MRIRIIGEGPCGHDIRVVAVDDAGAEHPIRGVLSAKWEATAGSELHRLTLVVAEPDINIPLSTTAEVVVQHPERGGWVV